jgi:ribosomal protein S18 acetylase RimI-like enzyme
MSSIRWQWQGCVFFCRNAFCARLLVDLRRECFSDVVLRGARVWELAAIDRLQRDLRGGRGWNFWRWLLYLFRGSRLLAVAVTPCGEIVGMQMLYFMDDSDSLQLHSAFVGVRSNWRGNGIATRLRRHVVKCHLGGSVEVLSERVSRSNTASLSSALRAGATVVNSEDSILLLRYQVRRDA